MPFYFTLFPYIVPTAAPQNPSGMPITSTLIRLDWLPPPSNHINGIIIFYLVEVEEVLSNQTWTFHAVQNHINIGPLHPHYAYRCRVAANTIGLGPYTPFFLVNAGETSESNYHERVFNNEMIPLCSSYRSPSQFECFTHHNNFPFSLMGSSTV